jgi:hypothetical protein
MLNVIPDLIDKPAHCHSRVGGSPEDKAISSVPR